MSGSNSRFIAIWASHEARAKLWFRLFIVATAGLLLSLVTTIRVWHHPREVVRIGCDGIPQVVTLDNQAYSEPNEREIRAFVPEMASTNLRVKVAIPLSCCRKFRITRSQDRITRAL